MIFMLSYLQFTSRNTSICYFCTFRGNSNNGKAFEVPRTLKLCGATILLSISVQRNSIFMCVRMRIVCRFV